MTWLYPMFIGLAFVQALIMRRLGMVAKLPCSSHPIYLSACYPAWGIFWLVTILKVFNLLTYWWLFSLFAVCFPFIYWGYMPVKKRMSTSDRLAQIICQLELLFIEVDTFAYRNIRKTP